MEKKYTTDWFGISIVFGLLGGVFVLFAFLGLVKDVLPGGAWTFFGFVLFYLYLLIPPIYFLYLKIIDKKILTLNEFGFKKQTEIKNISRIQKGALYKGAGSIYPALWIIYENPTKQKEDYFGISLGMFKEKTIQELLKDLLEINPNIKLDSYCQKLISKKFKK